MLHMRPHPAVSTAMVVVTVIIHGFCLALFGRILRGVAGTEHFSLFPKGVSHGR